MLVVGRTRPSTLSHVVAEEPPTGGHWQRQSFWVLALADAREQNKWVRVQRFYTAATAAQIASDIRSAHNRSLETLRVRGILPGEVWNARWAADEKCPPGNFSIWIKFQGYKK